MMQDLTQITGYYDDMGRYHRVTTTYDVARRRLEFVVAGVSRRFYVSDVDLARMKDPISEVRDRLRRALEAELRKQYQAIGVDYGDVGSVLAGWIINDGFI